MLSIQSQLLYIVCRPVFVILKRLTQEQIHDLKQNPSKYRCLVPNVSIDNRKMITKDDKRTRPNVSSKRKAPSDESDTNAMEENVEKVACNKINNVELTDFESTSSCDGNNTTAIHSIKETTLCAKSSEAIAVIDLCSSDEEGNICIPASSNENKDSINSVSKDLADSLEKSSFF